MHTNLTEYIVIPVISHACLFFCLCVCMYAYANPARWLIEVNASPSLTASSPADHALKSGLLTDMLDIIDMEGRLLAYTYSSRFMFCIDLCHECMRQEIY